MANLAFGGHVIWGDVSDSLEDVYDCSRPLPAILGAGGRTAIASPSEESACYLSGEVTLFVSAAAATSVCSPLFLVPVFGFGAAVQCQATVAGTAAALLLTTPVVEGLTLHGGQKLTSGALLFGGILSESWLGYTRAVGNLGVQVNASFNKGLIAETDTWPAATPTLAWYPKEEEGWHSYIGQGKTHNQYQADMIRRAYEGGMRLGVWDVVNSRALAIVGDGNGVASDWQALKDQTDAAKRVVSTKLSHIAKIVYTPEEAEATIRSGRMAVILGSEVDELGRMRPSGLPWPRSPLVGFDSMQKQIDDLWALGIRKISPVHAVNNPIGGAAIFDDRYVANNYFLNGTPLDGTPLESSGPLTNLIFDMSLGGIPLKAAFGDFSLTKKLGGDGRQPWNPQGWFEFDTSTPDPVIGSDYPVTYRVGQGGIRPDSPNAPRTLLHSDGSWKTPSEVLNHQILQMYVGNDLARVLQASGRCDLHNTFIPAFVDKFGEPVDTQYVNVAGHRNMQGIFVDGGEDGIAFFRAAMKKGILLDVDHMSERMRGQVYTLAATYAREAGIAAAGCPQGQTCGDYPVMGVHTTVRDLEKEGSSTIPLQASFGSNDESTRTPKEIAYVSTNGGTVGVFPRPNFIAPNTAGGQCTRDSDCAAWDGSYGSGGACQSGMCKSQTASELTLRSFKLPTGIVNDCDGSSKTFATKYLWMLEAMSGHGLTLTTDFNGMASQHNPRFGVAIPGKSACGQFGRGTSTGMEQWPAIMLARQLIEHSAVWYEDYASRAPVSSRWAKDWSEPDSQMPKRWKEVVARDSTEDREDRAPKFQTYSDGKPIKDLVTYNNRGADYSEDWHYGGNVPGAQLAPMKRWKKFRSGWDFNLDGLQHVGLLPDLLQDMRNVGVQWEQLAPLMHGAQDLLDTWRRSNAISQAHP
ncbi:hypothetical protein M2D63_014550 [Pseudomonas sp. BJa5]|uniref:hypothetical protein n=1 Tax=Pseudomonas sp. BJa5 TaxID=2936270 RepID=UPI00255A1EA7|nr:hypothetical protein [Pseudomonas sp. BGr12]MDL2422339.1 hypothetical protein [Pseudomonas sp. BGr12]